jgi:hypothetical protein
MPVGKLKRNREVTKSSGGKHIEISKYNPMTGTGVFKEKDVEYKTKGSPRVKYVEKQVVKRDNDLNWKSSKESRKLVIGGKKVKSTSDFQKYKTGGSTAAWTRKEGKNPTGGLNAKGVASYRAANPGSKLKTAVTTKPSKIKPGSEAAGRRKSFCSRMSGMKKKLTSSKTANDPNSRINKSLRKWNC